MYEFRFMDSTKSRIQKKIIFEIEPMYIIGHQRLMNRNQVIITCQSNDSSFG